MPEPPAATSRPATRRPATLALAMTLLLFAALALFGARYHWLEEAGSAERDGYVAQAEAILAGELPRDPFRPALYPLAVAGVARLGVPPFAAARLLSNLSAALLAWLAWWLGRRLAGPPAGWAAFALTAVNPNLWVVGQHTTTDMPFAAVAAATLVAAMAYLDLGLGRGASPLTGSGRSLEATTAAVPRGPLVDGAARGEGRGRKGRAGWGLALGVGALLGLAAFLRANGLFLVPAVAVAWWIGSRVAPKARRWGHLLTAGGAMALTLVPHFALRAAAFGDPLHDENWKNLAFKLYGFPDWSYLERVPFDGLLDVVVADPGRVVVGLASELWRFVAGGGLSQLLGTPLHALLFACGTLLALVPLRLRHPPTSPEEPAQTASRRAGSGRASALPSPLAVRTLWLLFAAATFLAAVALTFFTWGRLLLVLLPVGNALAALPWGSDPDLRRTRSAILARGSQWIAALRRRRDAAARSHLASATARLRKAGARWLPGGWAASVLLLLVALLAAKTFLFRLPAFVERHPYAEVGALRALAAELPPGTVLAGTSPFLERYLDRPYLYVPDAFGPEVADPSLYFLRLRRLLAEAGAAYLVTGPTDLRDRPAGLLGEEPPVPWLGAARDGIAPETRTSAVVRVWKVEIGEAGRRP